LGEKKGGKALLLLSENWRSTRVDDSKKIKAEKRKEIGFLLSGKLKSDAIQSGMGGGEGGPHFLGQIAWGEKKYGTCRRKEGGLMVCV